MSNINCEVCLLDSSADPVMWKCVGCTRKFHAACVGVVVPRGSLRNLKKDKKAVDPSSFVLPCCESCQTLVTANFEFNLLTQQQKQLAGQINANTEVIHRLKLQLEKPNSVAETMEGFEVLLNSIKNELSFINKNSSLAGSVIAIKNHITSLIDASIKSAKENVNSATSELKSHLQSQLNQNTIETLASCTIHNTSTLEVDILDELKMLTASINEIKVNRPVSPTPDSLPSLEVELNNNNKDQSGWRLLGTRNVWRADWTDYDKRKLHRLKQQKQAEIARKRKKQARNNNSNNTQHNRSLTSRPTNIQHNRYNHHVNTSCNIDGALNLMRGHSNSLLPPDRILLAAAKERFSKPPRWSSSDAPITHRPIQFQSGEILNPYPTHEEFPRSTSGRQPNWMSPGCSSNSGTSCEACHAQHSCFRRN